MAKQKTAPAPVFDAGTIMRLCREMKMPPEHLRAFELYADRLAAGCNEVLAATAIEAEVAAADDAGSGAKGGEV